MGWCLRGTQMSKMFLRCAHYSGKRRDRVIAVVIAVVNLRFLSQMSKIFFAARIIVKNRVIAVVIAVVNPRF